jgi:hypothetical protein
MKPTITLPTSTNLTLLAAIAGLAAGCAATPLATRPVTSHVVHIAGSGKKLGLVQDPVTGQYSLGYQSLFIGVTTVPITTAMDTNGTLRFIEPDAVASYEIAGKGGYFGAAGSTYTVAVGPNAVQTLIGGQHLPINSQLWTNSSVNLATLPTTGPAAAPATGSVATPATPLVPAPVK